MDSKIKIGFEKYCSIVTKLNIKDENELLTLYGLYKQALYGDTKGDKPSIFQFKNRAKYNAWEKQKGKSHDQAALEYIELVRIVRKKYPLFMGF